MCTYNKKCLSVLYVVLCGEPPEDTIFSVLELLLNRGGVVFATLHPADKMQPNLSVCIKIMHQFKKNAVFIGKCSAS